MCKEKVAKFSAAAKNHILVQVGKIFGGFFGEFLADLEIVTSNLFGLKMVWALRGHHGLSNRERTEKKELQMTEIHQKQNFDHYEAVMRAKNSVTQKYRFWQRIFEFWQFF